MPMTMKTLRLGRSELVVSRIGMGGIPIQRPTADQAVDVVRRALELGVNFIDTSRGYQDSERRIGKGIAGRRSEVTIATKGGWSNKSVAADCIDRSLSELDTDWIDLWQFHGVNTMDGFEGLFAPGGAMEAAQEALKAGKIRHIGLSSHSPDVALAAVASGEVETVQFPFNFIGWERGEEVAALAKAQDVGFIAMKPFGGGILRRADLVTRYILQFDHVLPIPGIESEDEIEEIVRMATAESQALSQKDLDEIEEIRERVGTRFCRRCMYCMPCPQGLRISSLMNMPVMWDIWPREDIFNEEAPIGAYMKRNAESVEKCVQCGICETKCPYELPIREMIAEHARLYQQKTVEYQRQA